MKGMLFTEVPTTYLPEMVGNDDWVFQQKMDGTRAIVTITQDSVRFWSRSGAPLKHAAAALHFPALRTALEPVQWLLSSPEHHVTLDGELLIHDGSYHVFDLPRLDLGMSNSVTEATSQIDRYRTLGVLLSNVTGKVHRVRQAETPESKAALARDALLRGVEGIVAKRRDGDYQPGVRVKHTLKVKFVKTADVVVMEATRDRNEAGREVGSIRFGVHDAEGNLRPLGACSIIGKPHVEPGYVIEVAYLKFETAPVQPRMLRVREDKAPQECTLDQFPTYSYEAV